MAIEVAAPSQDGFDVYSLVHMFIAWSLAWALPGTPSILVGFIVVHMVFEIWESSISGQDACALLNGNMGVRWPHFEGDSAINTNCDTFSFAMGFVLLHYRTLWRHLCASAGPTPAAVPTPAAASASPSSSSSTTSSATHSATAMVEDLRTDARLSASADAFAEMSAAVVVAGGSDGHDAAASRAPQLSRPYLGTPVEAALPGEDGRPNGLPGRLSSNWGRVVARAPARGKGNCTGCTGAV